MGWAWCCRGWVWRTICPSHLVQETQTAARFPTSWQFLKASWQFCLTGWPICQTGLESRSQSFSYATSLYADQVARFDDEGYLEWGIPIVRQPVGRDVTEYLKTFFMEASTLLHYNPSLRSAVPRKQQRVGKHRADPCKPLRISTTLQCPNWICSHPDICNAFAVCQ